MVPPGLSGRLEHMAGEGHYTIEDEIYRITGNPGHSGRLAHSWPVRRRRPFAERRKSAVPLVTGQRVIDTFFPIARGGTAVIPGGFGTGKTMTQHALAKWCDADIIIHIGCGERGNEMTEVLKEFPELSDPRTGRPLMERTVLIANTSNMPVPAREVSIYTGITMAEYYRDMGYHVAVMADSTSRWAEALRELSSRLGDMPAEEGFPVTQHTSRVVRCFWALDKSLADARHYPSISWIDSYSEYIDDVSSWWNRLHPSWQVLRNGAMEVLLEDSRLQQIVKLVGSDALPPRQRLTLFTADIIRNGFLQQNSFDPVDMYCLPEKQLMLLEVIMDFHRHAGDLIAAGTGLKEITSLKSAAGIMRLKSDADEQGLGQIREYGKAMKAELMSLGKARAEREEPA
jgi:V/A-type H+-transporting ATPase subunit A